MLEELVILTAILADSDPRLRDEALDWCASHHQFISVRRLQTLCKAFNPHVQERFSTFASTLNSIVQTKWPIFFKAIIPKVIPSGKSKPPKIESPALLNLRLRAMFGVGARADLLTFCLMQEKNEYSVSDLTEIGYSKRNLAVVLDELVMAGIFNVTPVRNQRRYFFIKRDLFTDLLKPLPKNFVAWHLYLDLIFSLRTCILKNENKSTSTKAVEIRNLLIKQASTLQKLHLSPPPMQPDLAAYWASVEEWILKISSI